MRALVTGGAGFIGSTLVDRLLAEDHTVDVIDDLSTGSLANLADARALRGGRLTFHQLDIRSAECVELVARRQPEVVFHLAAQADVRVSVADPVFDADVNVIGTLRVLEGARRAGTGRVVFTTSGGTIYGEPDDSELPLRESLPLRPLSPYGVSKKAGIDYLEAYRELLLPRILRPGSGQRLRAATGPPWRGRSGGHLRRTAASWIAPRDFR